MRAQAAGDQGFSLLDSLIACVLLAGAVMALSHLLALGAAQNLGSRHMTRSAILAAQKIEELHPQVLAPSPPSTLEEDTTGYVDYLDSFGDVLDAGAGPPPATAYIRRWSIVPLAAEPANTQVIQVLVRPNVGMTSGAMAVRGEVRLVTARRRGP